MHFFIPSESKFVSVVDIIIIVIILLFLDPYIPSATVLKMQHNAYTHNAHTASWSEYPRASTPNSESLPLSVSSNFSLWIWKAIPVDQLKFDRVFVVCKWPSSQQQPDAVAQQDSIKKSLASQQIQDVSKVQSVAANSGAHWPS